ncbi:MAG: ABC transporter ATP-binding protein [Planctomycetota bacterium]
MKPLLTLRNITKSYKSRTVLDRLDLDIFEGERFFILGPSGCGKTTLLRIIAGLDSKHEGTVEINGRKMVGNNRFTPPHRRGVGLVFQDGALWPHLTVEKHLSYTGKSPEDRKRQDHLLALTGLETRRKDYPSSLSGGERQRLALARALAGKPDILLFDEPLRNLDRNLAIEMRYAIRDILEQTRMTSIFVTHDQEEALSMADRIMLMNQDGPVQIGTPREVFQSPNTLWAAAFFGPVNCFSAETGLSGPMETPWGLIDTGQESTSCCDVVFRASQVVANVEKRGIRARVKERRYQGDELFLICETGEVQLYAVARSAEVENQQEVFLELLGKPMIIRT